ncbi:hypothetical protein LOTGIDRAFT_172780 [Lottia gigantea]|uniref:Apple domain-containing protein n=1 Tax=Lottia gigantea TaxID=225164 RepID=V4CGE2_LOTGI|nr:hypothetical protein LOTGIDRAFT_172780 [Lottia gigantea]ESP01150.1 hypothetical protein LOTGIDRAFT_172780 [Lottia gigantea]
MRSSTDHPVCHIIIKSYHITDVNGVFVCPSVVYGSLCYWTTTKELYNDINSKCAINGGEFTYFPDIYTIENLEVLVNNSDFLQNTSEIYVNLTKKSPGVWVFKDGTEALPNLWASRVPPTNDPGCTYMNYVYTQYKLRLGACNKAFRGLCGRQLNVSNERFAVKSGRLLNNTGLTMQSPTIAHCSLACFQTSWCRSCNYQIAEHQCELNLKTKEEEYLSYFVNSVDWKYISYSVDY